MGKTAFLHCTTGGSDKVYNIYLEDRPNGTAVLHGMNGRRGSTLVRQDKIFEPIPYAQALRQYEALKLEKINKKQYRLVNETDTNGGNSMVVQETSIDIVTGKVSKKTTTIPAPEVPATKTVIIAPQLLNVIDEAEVMRLIEDDAYMAQEKKDGHRRLALTDPYVTGLNKKGEAIILVESIVKSLPKGMSIAIDGEQIGDRLHAFDILMRDKKSLREVDAIRRYQILSSIEFGKDIQVVYTAMTTAEKRALYERLKAENKEGIVFKRKNSAYKSGRPNSGGDHLKFQFRKRASFIVENITKGKRSIGVVVLENNTRVPIGKCTIPPNHEIPKVGEVVEIQYLHAFKGGAIYQPVYFGKRDDVDAHECLIKQIVFKPEDSDPDEL